MKYIAVILSVIAFTTGLSHTNRILGGQNAISGQFPYAVAFNTYNHYCNGVIIAPYWILTAARCLNHLSPFASVYVGSHINRVNGTEYRITNTFIHEYFNSWTYQNDIGLIRLETDLEFGDTIQSIEFSEAVAPGTTCIVMGWGQTQDEAFPENLQYLETTFIDIDTCQNITDGVLLGAYLGPEQVCTLPSEGQGTCDEDAGGPLVCNGRLAGIVSYHAGFTCGVQRPDVYTSILAYLNWILPIIQP